MWPLTASSDSYIALDFTSSALTLSWLTPHYQQIKKTFLSPFYSNTPQLPLSFNLNAFQSIPCTNLEYENGRINNPTIFKKYIRSFLTTHKIGNAYCCVSITDPTIKEEIISLTQAQETSRTASRSQLFDRVSLFSHDGITTSYECTMDRSHLFQYQALAIAVHLNLVSITPRSMALLHLYRFAHGKQFSHSKLSLDLHKNNNAFEHLISPEMGRKFIHIPPSVQFNYATDMPNLLVALGLSIAQCSQAH